jgi:hypothetical protein
VKSTDLPADWEVSMSEFDEKEYNEISIEVRKAEDELWEEN